MLVHIQPASGARLGKRQEYFNRLVKQVSRLKAELAEWARALPDIHRRVADHERRRLEHDAVLADLVRLFDRAHGERGLTKTDKKQLRGIICELAHDLLQGGGPEDLKEIYNRHTRGDFDAEQAEELEAHARMMQAVLEHNFGVDFGGRELSSVDEVQRAAFEQLDDQERRAREEAARRPPRKKTKKQVAAEAAQVNASKAIQDVFRKLARALHPDHEPDPVERARKTELMQAVNVAYEAKDLLKLLELQLRVEQVDQAHLDGIADDRLEHFIRLLKEQLAQLRAELAEVQQPWRIQIDWPPPRGLSADYVLAHIGRDVARLASRIVEARRDLADLADVRNLAEWLRDQRV